MKVKIGLQSTKLLANETCVFFKVVYDVINQNKLILQSFSYRKCCVDIGELLYENPFTLCLFLQIQITMSMRQLSFIKIPVNIHMFLVQT